MKYFMFYVLGDGESFDREGIEMVMKHLGTPRMFKVSYKCNRKQNTGYVFYPEATSRHMARDKVINAIHNYMESGRFVCFDDIGGRVFENKSKYGGGRKAMKITEVATMQEGRICFDVDLLGECVNLTCFERRLRGDDIHSYKPSDFATTILKNRLKHGRHAIKQVDSIEEKTGVIYDRRTGEFVRSNKGSNGFERWLESKPLLRGQWIPTNVFVKGRLDLKKNGGLPKQTLINFPVVKKKGS